MAKQANVVQDGVEQVREAVRLVDQRFRRIQKQVESRRRRLAKEVTTRRRILEKRAQRELGRLQKQIQKQPLVKRADFERFAGFEARIETVQPVAGRKRFRGRLMGVTGEDVRLREPAKDGAQKAQADDMDNETRVPLAAIARAKLVLTDELIAATQTTKRV